MGWNVNIALKQPITEAELGEVIKKLPKELHEKSFGKQEWGWSLKVDVHLRNPNEVGLSGSYGISREWIEPATTAFLAGLKEYGPTAGELH